MLGEEPPQLLHRTRDALSCPFLGNAQRPAHINKSLPFVKSQQHRLRILPPEPGNRFVQQRRKLAPFRIARDLQIGFRGNLLAPLTPRLLPQRFRRGKPHYPKQPARHDRSFPHRPRLRQPR